MKAFHLRRLSMVVTGGLDVSAAQEMSVCLPVCKYRFNMAQE